MFWLFPWDHILNKKIKIKLLSAVLGFLEVIKHCTFHASFVTSCHSGSYLGFLVLLNYV